MGKLSKLIKPFIPAPILRRIYISRAAKSLREFYFGRQLRTLKPLILETGETHNFTYDLTDENLRYMAEMIAIATDKSPIEIEEYIHEAINDGELRAHFDSLMTVHDGQKSPDNVRSPFGRRLGWYAVARATKPRVLIETGVERGHGGLILCAALLRNRDEGSPGQYFGTDINPQAGWLITGKYASVGKILIGDSLASLRAISAPIDLFINDSDHSAEYEAREYEEIAPKLGERAIVLGDNAHVTDKLAVFSRNHGRSFIMFHEQPRNHWYPGAGIGMSFYRRNRTP